MFTKQQEAEYFNGTAANKHREYLRQVQTIDLRASTGHNCVVDAE